MMQHMPNEILAHIFSNLECKDAEDEGDPKSSYSSLLSLSRVCKKFRPLAEASLYTNIFLLEEDDGRRWQQLATDLQRDPKLGLNTKQLCIGRFDHIASPDLIHSLAKHFLNFSLSTDCDSIPPGLRTVILRELESDIWDRPYPSLRALFLLLMPRLQKIDLTLNDMNSMPFLLSERFNRDEDYGCDGLESDKGRSRHDLVPNTRYFRDLETVALRVGYDSPNAPPTRARTLRGLLYHPNIKALKLDGFVLLRGSCIGLCHSNVPSNLTSLDFDNCALTPYLLKRILERFRNLKHLNLALEGFGGHDDPTSNLEDFGSVLREFGQNLVELSISKPIYDPQLAGPHNYVGSLRELTGLRHLYIGRLNLVGSTGEGTEQQIMLHDALPQSLEILTLEPGVKGCSCDLNIVRQTEQQVCNMLRLRQAPPTLKQVHMKPPPGPEARGHQMHEVVELGGWQIGKKGVWVRRRGNPGFGMIHFLATATRVE
jgi:hypothetical protein